MNFNSNVERFDVMCAIETVVLLGVFVAAMVFVASTSSSNGRARTIKNSESKVVESRIERILDDKRSPQ